MFSQGTIFVCVFMCVFVFVDILGGRGKGYSALCYLDII